MIKVKIGIGVVSYTEEELQQELQDLDFLRDAFLVLLNEKVAQTSDLMFDKKQVIKYAYKMYEDTNYSKEFIDKCFSQ